LRLVQRFREWRDKKKWLKLQDMKFTHFSVSLMEQQLKENERFKKRQREKEKLIKKILNNKDKDSYVS